MAFAGVEKLPEHEGDIIWQIAARLSTYKKLGKSNALDKAKRKIEKAKAQVHAKIELLFRVIKRQPSPCKDALPRPGEEQVSVDEFVYPVKSMDGALVFPDYRTRGVSVIR